LNLADPEFDQKLIEAIYAERGRKDAQGKLVYFSRNCLRFKKVWRDGL
jgi:hypothetical protein